MRIEIRMGRMFHSAFCRAMQSTAQRNPYGEEISRINSSIDVEQSRKAVQGGTG